MKRKVFSDFNEYNSTSASSNFLLNFLPATVSSNYLSMNSKDKNYWCTSGIENIFRTESDY